MAEDNKVEENKTEDSSENQYLEDNFKLYGIFRMRWDDIKELNEVDRAFLLKKADEVEERAKYMAEQQQKREQMQMDMVRQQAATAAGGIVTPDQVAQEAAQLQL